LAPLKNLDSHQKEPESAIKNEGVMSASTAMPLLDKACLSAALFKVIYKQSFRKTDDSVSSLSLANFIRRTPTLRRSYRLSKRAL